MSASASSLCDLFLTDKDGCNLTGDSMKQYFESGPVQVFTKEDGAFTGDKKYDAPVGWHYKKMKHFAGEPTVDGSWDLCYHGTQMNYVPTILRNRLLLPGTKTPDKAMVEIQPGHIGGSNHIHTSPSYHFASLVAYAWPKEWAHGGKKYWVRVMFMVKQKKNTFTVERMSLAPSCWDPNVRIDDHFKNEEIEWISDKPRDIVMDGILLHFSEVPPIQLTKEREAARKGKFVEPTMSDERASFQYNMDTEQLMILWVDDKPANNTDLVDIIQKCGVHCVCRRDTESALKELKDHVDSYFCVITDLVRTEKRTGDTVEKNYYEAGIDFIRLVRSAKIDVPIFMYSSWCREHKDLCTKSLDVGANKICTRGDIIYMIRRE